jgi:catechol 2,3-dioxygenase-like lactoylglutathione lyase family enzyme
MNNPGSKPRVLGPDFFSLQVRDLEASKKFYVDRLGLTVMQGPPHAVVFDTKPIPFAIRDPLVDLDKVPQLGWGVALWLAADAPTRGRDDRTPSA